MRGASHGQGLHDTAYPRKGQTAAPSAGIGPPPDLMAGGRVVLVGAGHGHLHVARHADRFRRRGLELILVDPGAFWYSGLATGALGGGYEPAEDRLDPAPLVERGGGRFVRDRAVDVDPAARALLLASGRRIGWDALSFNVGSEVPLERVRGAARHARPVKPIPGLIALRRILERPRSRPPRLLVVGGGATGCEVAANLEALCRRHAPHARIVLATRSERLLPRAPAGAARALAERLRRRGVRVLTAEEVVAVDAGAGWTAAGERLPADHVVAATGLRPPAEPPWGSLPAGPRGGLLVDATLQVPGHPGVFGVGDCVDFGPRPLPSLGVFAVRQGPVLLDNLLAAVSDGDRRPYRPQRRWLYILNLGDGTALAIRGGLWWLGRASMWLKDWLDRRFLERHRV